jgi:hypothetical protein
MTRTITSILTAIAVYSTVLPQQTKAAAGLPELPVYVYDPLPIN